MKEQFVTYEIALALKEFGFDEPCLTKFEQHFNKENLQAIIATVSLNPPYEFEYNGYDQKIINDQEHRWFFTGYKNSVKDHGNVIITAPLWQQAIDWFEKRFSLLIAVDPIRMNVSDKEGYKFTWYIINGKNMNQVEEDETPIGYSTYYEAREQALLKAIEICQSS